MHHCWVRLSECAGACMHSACVSFLCVNIHKSVSVPTSLWEGVCLCLWVLGLAYFPLCISVRMHVSISFQLATNWETRWQHHTVWDSWAIWAVSGLLSLWALLYTHCKAWKKGGGGFASTAVVPWLHALQTKHNPTQHSHERADTTPQCHLVDNGFITRGNSLNAPYLHTNPTSTHETTSEPALITHSALFPLGCSIF